MNTYFAGQKVLYSFLVKNHQVENYTRLTLLESSEFTAAALGLKFLCLHNACA